LEYITVDGEAPGPEGIKVNGGPKASADEALNFCGSAFDGAAFSATTVMCGMGKHAVFRCDPAFAGGFPPTGQIVSQ
jgi:hypothetical protein